MIRLKVVLIGAAVTLSACNSGSVAASASEEGAPTIPAAYHGTYSATAESCVLLASQDYHRLVLSANRMEVHFHDGPVIAVADDMRNIRANGIVVTSRVTVEGHVMEQTRALRREPGSTSVWLQSVPRPVKPGQSPPPPGVSAPQLLVRCVE